MKNCKNCGNLVNDETCLVSGDHWKVTRQNHKHCSVDFDKWTPNTGFVAGVRHLFGLEE